MTLSYAPPEELTRARDALVANLAVASEMAGVPARRTRAYTKVRDGSSTGATNQFTATVEITRLAALCRINALYMIMRAGSGHIGGSFSAMDIICHLLFRELREGDIAFSSKGHDAPAWYSALIAAGVLPFDALHTLRRIKGLPGHPDIRTPGIHANTGSLGMGISKAKGILAALPEARAFVLTGDGELQEGQIWESLASAQNCERLTIIVDHNKLQSDTALVSAFDACAAFSAFGWHTQRIDGHDFTAIARALSTPAPNRARVIIADTVKGKGVSFMERPEPEFYPYHSGVLSMEAYAAALEELNAQAAAPLTRVSFAPAPPAPGERMIPAYSEALLNAADRHPNLVALDADLLRDTGLEAFRARHPQRFHECGIAEQDMVSQAGGMALKGLLPVVHSFACFLTARANEQIHNNATEATRIVYVGSLAGLLPAAPGHSHQAVRDIAALKGIPNMLMVEPSCAAEIAPALAACLAHEGSSYLRLSSVPWPVHFTPPRTLIPGQGYALTHGDDIALIAYGSVMLSEAVSAARLLERENIGLRVIALPWLNRIDAAWLAQSLRGVRALVTLDNHYIEGGQGETVLAALMESGVQLRCLRLGVRELPVCGTNAEALTHHGLDAASIATRVRELL